MKLVSSRGQVPRSTFRAAALGHAPADGGLWVPESLPAWDDVEALLALWRSVVAGSEPSSVHSGSPLLTANRRPVRSRNVAS